MPARKAAPKSGAAETERTSTTRGRTVQEVTEEESSGVESRGFFGEAVDPTPNEHYTISGVLAGKPVPETDRQ